MMKRSGQWLVLALVIGLAGIAGAWTALPVGYEALEYVESTGSQYIDSGYCVKADDVVTAVFKAEREQPEGESGVFGQQPVEPPWNNACAFDVRMGETGAYRLWRGTGSCFRGRRADFYGQKVEVVVDPAGFKWKPYGATAWAETSACAPRGDTEASLYVFAIHSAAYDFVCPIRFGAVKLYSLSITSGDGKAQRTFAPCRRTSDGEIGLYDTVEGRFYQNRGAEPLLASGAPRVGTFAGAAKSPNGQNEIRLWANPLAYEVRRGGETLVAKTEIGLKVDGHRLGPVATVQRTQAGTRAGRVETPIYKKRAIDLAANETEVDFGDWSVRLVARNDGVAYRFETRRKGEIRVDGEQAGVTIPDAAADCVWTPETRYGCEEAIPRCSPAGQLPFALNNRTREHFYLPFVYAHKGKAVAVVDSDTQDYPVWNLRRRVTTAEGVRLEGDFARWPAFAEFRGFNVAVRKRMDYLVRTPGTRTFPWRGFLLADSMMQLNESDLIDALARPPEGDFSWVKPGRVIWDWWCYYDNQGVEKGCTTQSYRRYIDFAAKYGIEYVYLDGVSDVERTIFWDKVPKFDIPGLVQYAKQRGVGLFVWLPISWFKGNEADLIEWAADVGLKGFKIDYLDRGDAEMERFVWRFADLCAKRKLMVDYHGAHRPAGLCRTYPNAVGFEGVHGLECMRWFHNDYDFMACDLGLCFTRLLAGTMDYTPGAMDNHPLGKYRKTPNNPGSVGTRCRQMALVMVLQGYVQMLAEGLTKYEKNAECFKFIAGIPAVWDDIVSLGGTPTSYAALARRTGDVWYAAAIANSQKQDVTIETAFLGKGEWTAEIFSDAADAATEPTHYIHREQKVKAGETMSFTLAPGGGFIIRFTRNRQ